MKPFKIDFSFGARVIRNCVENIDSSIYRFLWKSQVRMDMVRYAPIIPFNRTLNTQKNPLSLINPTSFKNTLHYNEVFEAP